MKTRAIATPSRLMWSMILCALLAGASYLASTGAATAAFVPYLIVAELAYLAWGAGLDRQHRGRMLAFALQLNIQAALRTSVGFVLGVSLLFALSALPGFSATAVLKLVGHDADPFVGLAALFKMTLAASIGLAAARLACARRHGIDGKELASGSYLRPSIRVTAPKHFVEQLLAERLAALSQPGAPRLDTVFPASVTKVVEAEEDGQQITRVFFSFFSLRMTFSVRALDHARTEVRVWIRLRGSMRLIDLFPNPVAVAKLLAFLHEEIFDPLRWKLGAPGSASASAA